MLSFFNKSKAVPIDEKAYQQWRAIQKVPDNPESRTYYQKKWVPQLKLNADNQNNRDLANKNILNYGVKTLPILDPNTTMTAAPGTATAPSVAKPPVPIIAPKAVIAKPVVSPEPPTVTEAKKLIPIMPSRPAVPIAITPRVLNVPQLKADHTNFMNTAKPVVETPAAPDMIDGAIADYGKQLDDVNQRANIVDGAKALGNITSLVTAFNLDAPPDLQAPTIKAPQLISPGQYVREAQQAELDKQVNSSNRILAETGKSDAIVGNSANAMEAVNKIATETVGMDVQTANRQMELDATADNTNSIAKIDAYNRNIERKLQYNMLRGQTMTDALNALGEQGTNYVNRMGQTAYGKFQARMSGEEAKAMQNYQLTQTIMQPITDKG